MLFPWIGNERGGVKEYVLVLGMVCFLALLARRKHGSEDGFKMVPSQVVVWRASHVCWYCILYKRLAMNEAAGCFLGVLMRGKFQEYHDIQETNMAG